MRYLLLAATAAALAVVTTPIARRIALRLGAVDAPGLRRVNASPVPRMGGLSVLAAAAVTIALAWRIDPELSRRLAVHGWSLGWLGAGVAVVFVTGMIDDVRGLPALAKLGLQLVAAALALAGGYGLGGMANPLTGTYVSFGPLASLLTLVWIVAITNAINLMDGLDGLAAGVVVIASATLFAVSLVEGRGDAAYFWATLGGAVAGFLVYNFNPASIFLGDSGSLVLGYLLAVLSIQSLQKSATAVVVVTPVLALGLPLVEVALTTLRRGLAAGPTAIVRADRAHIHHVLLTRGMSHRTVVLALYGVCVLFGVLAFSSVLVHDVANAVIVAVAVFVTFAGVRAIGLRSPGGSEPPAETPQAQGERGGTARSASAAERSA